MTEEEKQEIIAEVLASLKVNSKTIDQLTEVLSAGSDDYFELNRGRRISFVKVSELASAGASSEIGKLDQVVSEALNDLNDRINIVEGRMKDKQDTLVSGKNIKTVQGHSLVGNGDVDLLGNASIDDDGYLIFEV